MQTTPFKLVFPKKIPHKKKEIGRENSNSALCVGILSTRLIAIVYQNKPHNVKHLF